MYSKKVHTAKASSRSSRLSQSKRTAKRTKVILPTRHAKSRTNRSYISANRTATVARNTILTVIGLAMLAVLAFTIFNFIATPEFLVKREVESITKDYYENYFYPQILENNSLSRDESDPAVLEPIMSEALKRYIEHGFARVSLRQLTLYDDRRHGASASALSEYCNLDQTLIKIYPESPFTSTNYRVEYDYSCKF